MTNFITKNDYQERREKLLNMFDDCAILLVGEEGKIRSSDNEFEFHQSGNFYYLTGISETKCALLLIKKQGKTSHILFVRPKDAMTELWNGPMLGLDAAKNLYYDEVFEFENLSKTLTEKIKGLESVAYTLKDQKAQSLLGNSLKDLNNLRRREFKIPRQSIDLTWAIEKLRGRKSAAEISAMEKAIAITDEAHRMAMAYSKANLMEYKIEALLRGHFRAQGGSGPAYPPIVASGSMACCLHYVNNDRAMQAGELLLIDAGAEYQNYAADITRTFPVDKKFSDVQKVIYEIVLKTQQEIINMVKPGVTLRELNDKTADLQFNYLLEAGVLTKAMGSPEKLKEDKVISHFYPHSVSHHLGIDVHDEVPYVDEAGALTKLEEGMVITVEPGLYFNGLDKLVDSKWHGIGVRIEDNILVTKNGQRNLSLKIPKTVAEIEEAKRQDYFELLKRTLA